jgi:endoglucanase
MNEPHDIPNTVSFFSTIQAAVEAIRSTGAFYQTILIPSTDWSAAATFHSNRTGAGSGPTLIHVRNPDGTTRELVFDVHAFSDGEFSAAQKEGDCASGSASSMFTDLANFLRCEGRKALVTAVGGLETAACREWVCKVTAFIKANSDGACFWCIHSILFIVVDLLRT